MIYLTDNLSTIDIHRWLPRLSEQRRQRVMAYRHDMGRRTSIAAYLLLCEALRREYAIDSPPVFAFGEHGKPVIVGHEDICFNMSHCSNAALCAVDGMPIGVDIERVRPWNESLVRYTMSDSEWSMIQESPQRELMFTQLWTMKEAVQKRSGEGIRSDMKDVLVGEQLVETAVSPASDYVYSVAFDPQSALRSSSNVPLSQRVITLKF